MSLDSIFCGRRKILAFISLVFILVGFIGGIVSGHKWWTKTKPWLKYGESTCCLHYYFPYIIWVVSIIGIIIFVPTFIFIFIKPIAENKCLSNFLLVLLFISSIFNWVFGIVIGTMGFSSDYYTDDWVDENSYNCYYDVFPSLFIKILYKANEQNKTEEYFNWSRVFYEKIIDNRGRFSFFTTFSFYEQYPDWVERNLNITEIVEMWFGFKNYRGDIDKKSIFNAIMEKSKPTFNDYLCSKVATPMISFAVVSFVGDVLLIIAFSYCNCKEKVGNGLDDEEDRSDFG